MSYTKDFSEIFAKIIIFPLINLKVKLVFIFPFRAIDLCCYIIFSQNQSWFVLILLFLKASSDFVSTSLVSFLYLEFLSFFLRASSASHSSLFWFSVTAILAFLKGSLYFTFARCFCKVCSISCSNKSLFMKPEA